MSGVKASFPTGPRASVDTGLLKAVAHLYGLEPASDVSDLGGAYNLNVRLRSTKGSYVARVYRPWVTLTRVRALQRLKGQLAEQQLPVVLPLATLDGSTCIVYSQRVVEVEPFAPNDGAVESWRYYERAFTLLGKLHRAFTDGLADSALPAPSVENYGTPSTLLVWIEGVQQHLKRRPDPEVPRALALCASSACLLKHLQGWWEQEEQHLPPQLIHGDYGVGNLLWQQGEIIAVGDFDFVARHERIFDIAYTLYWMFERLEPSRNHEVWSWHRVPALLARYDSARGQPLTRRERQALPFEMARAPLYWIAEACFLPNPLEAILSRAETVATARWLTQNARDLTWL